MLARIAHELYWLGRNLTRAEFTARVVDGVFQLELQGQPEAAQGVQLGWSQLVAMLDTPARGAAGDARPDALHRLTLDADAPGSMRASVERARDGARAVRDVISAEMWEAINTTALYLRDATRPSGWRRPDRSSPAATSRSASRSSAGSATARCCATRARRSSRPAADIEAADMVLRMLRVAFGVRRRARSPAAGPALALLQAVGGFQAFRRAVPAPPNAGPVARFLLFERAYPDSVAACVDSLHEALLAADTSPRDSEPVLRLSRLAADLEFQRRALPEDAEIGATCEAVQQELARVDQDVSERYFAGAGAPATTVV